MQVGKLDLTPAKNVEIEIKEVKDDLARLRELMKFIDGLTKRKRREDSDSDKSYDDEDEETAEPVPFKVIIFANMKTTVDNLWSTVTEKSRSLARNTFRVHGDYDQVIMTSLFDLMTS